MRVDKYLANNTQYSRKEIKKFIYRKWVKVNETKINDPSFKVESSDNIYIKGEKIVSLGFIYYVLDKPNGYVSAVKDKNHKVVTDLIPEQYKHLNLKPVGRLDKDTTGLLILTNDNKFIHKMTSPKNNVKKAYIVTLADEIKETYKKQIENGIKLKDGTTTKPAIFKKISNLNCELTLIEGKYHQVKRMFGALGNKVIGLRRIRFGDYKI